MKPLCAEVYKLLTLPSVWITLAGTFLLNVVLCTVIASSALNGAAGTPDILSFSFASMGYVQAGFVILGILAVCSEYAGGQIRTTLIAMPWRCFQLSAKLLALSIITIPAACMIASASILCSWIWMRDTSAAIAISTLAKSLAGATGYLTFTTLLSAAVGGLFKRMIPALAVLIGYYFVVSPLTDRLLPGLVPFLPVTAGYYMYMPSSSDSLHVLTPLQGTGVTALWTLIFIAAAVVVYRRRDA